METVSAKRDSPTRRESPYEPFGDDRPRTLIEGVGTLPMSATGTPQQKQRHTTDGPTAPHRPRHQASLAYRCITNHSTLSAADT